MSSERRLKREECRGIEHDSAFSPWKVLIGACDWEDHSAGKEGAERYRTENLPNCASCTGVYELGVSVFHGSEGRDSKKLDPALIVPVYIGKSDSVRTRLQQYGRDGAHLANGRLGESDEEFQNGAGLFGEVFSQGFSIVYRWAPMENTCDSEKTESDLLRKWDYAWNKDSNGTRRREDIHKKLKQVSKSSIKVYKVPSVENGLDFYPSLEDKGPLQRIIKFGRSQPRLVVSSGIYENPDSTICGIALGHGVVCKTLPTEGNKRCSEHKGMKVNGVTSNSKPLPMPSESVCVCGVLFDDGSSCTSIPVKGNKRCLEHKGMRIRSSIPPKMEPLNVEDNVYPSDSRVKIITCGLNLDNGSFCTRKPPPGRNRCEEHKGMRIKKTVSSVFVEGKSRKEEGENCLFIPPVSCSEENGRYASTCGAALRNGSGCRRRVAGGGRCWQHGGENCLFIPPVSCSEENGRYASTCGAALRNGSGCSRRVAGGGRCWQHGGQN